MKTVTSEQIKLKKKKLVKLAALELICFLKSLKWRVKYISEPTSFVFVFICANIYNKQWLIKEVQ